MLFHTVLHYGMAALFVAVGAVFLVLAVQAYRSSSDGRLDQRDSSNGLPRADAMGLGTGPRWSPPGS